MFKASNSHIDSRRSGCKAMQDRDTYMSENSETTTQIKNTDAELHTAAKLGKD